MIRKSIRIVLCVVTMFSVVFVSLLACDTFKKKDDDDDKDKTGETSTGTLAVSTNGLAASYPEGLAITAFPQAIDTDPGAATGTIVVQLTENPPQNNPPNDQGAGAPDFTVHPREKLKDSIERLNGEASDCFVGDPGQGMQGAMNNTEFCWLFDTGLLWATGKGTGDSGMVNNNNCFGGNATLESGKTCIENNITLTPDTSGEACMVVKGRNVIGSAVTKVDAVLNLVQGMLCQAKKNGVGEELPAEGATLDLVDVMPSGTTTYSEAKIVGLAPKDGRPVYKTSITYESSMGDSGDYEINLVHSPSAEGNAAYSGVIWFKTPESQQNASHSALSLQYEKTVNSSGEENLRYEVRNADVPTGVDAISSSGLVDYNKGADASGQFSSNNEAIQGIRYLAFDINPATFAGSISMWVNPGSNYEEKARGYVATTTQDTSGVLSGCAYSGASEASIRKAMNIGDTLLPAGCYTPQMSNGVCGAANDNQGTQVFRQCYKQNSAGKYLIDAAVTGDPEYKILPTKDDADLPSMDMTDLPTFEGVN